MQPIYVPRLALAIVAVLAMLLAGCFREGDENTNEGTDTSPGAVAVEVVLTDDGIEMPTELPAGAAMFEVTNGGTTPHGFAIEGVDDQLEELAPDQLDTLHLELEPGTYTVFSPVSGDADDGLELRLTVNEDEDGGGAPLNDEGVGGDEEQDEVDDE